MDFLGKRTKEPVSSNGTLLNPLEAPSPDGLHLLQIEKGTRVLDDEGKVVTLITVIEAEIPELP